MIEINRKSDVTCMGLIAFLVVAAISLVAFSACRGKAKIDAVLEKPIGIMTAGEVFSEFVPMGSVLPQTFSYTFTTESDEQSAVEIVVAQKDRSGREIVTAAIVDGLPLMRKGHSLVVVTVKIDEAKKLRMKVTVPETAYLKDFGPFDVR